ncbi:MAG: DUF4249 domain-containing protein [Saprospiraceae bacterium]|nr:DUF4249 domain-containing protein [Saprospiraceae bacterium]
MKKYSLPALYMLVAVLLLANCVREIDFQEEDADQSLLVVSGVFTDGYGPHILRLTRPGNYNKQVFKTVSDAEIRLSDDAGHTYTYQSVQPADKPAYYELRNVKGETGRTYTLNIKLANGEAYQSHPQIMPEPISLDTAEVKAEWYYTNTTAGAIVRAPFAFVYARTTAPAVTKDRFLHWESEAIYLFDEIFKFYEIFPVSHQCFINNRINDQVVALSDLSKYSPGGVVYENVGKRKIDQAFEKKIAFAVYQRAINREAYEYWNKISKLLEANGTIFDAPPAAVPGNVENTTHPDLPALGFFEVGAADTVRVFTGNGQLGSEFLLQNTPYCQLDYSKGWPPVNHPECDDCLTWIKGAYYEIPWWWQ